MSWIALLGVLSLLFGVLVILVLLNFRIVDLRKAVGVQPKDVKMDMLATVFALILLLAGLYMVLISTSRT